MSTVFAIPEYQTILIEQKGAHCLLATLNRPAALNAITTQMGHDLLDL